MKTLKKIITLSILGLWIIAFNTNEIFADGNNSLYKLSPKNEAMTEDPLHDYIPTKEEMNFLNNSVFSRGLSRSNTIWVPVSSPCDQDWRNEYPNNWMWQANRALTNADTMLNDKFGIQFYSVSQKEWNSNWWSADAVVKDAKKTWWLRDGATLMVAFSGKTFYDNDDNKIMWQVTEIWEPYAVVFDWGYTNNTETLQHEVGHSYGLRHRNNDDNCVMTATWMWHLDQICNTHKKQWKENKNKY